MRDALRRPLRRRLQQLPQMAAAACAPELLRAHRGGHFGVDPVMHVRCHSSAGRNLARFGYCGWGRSERQPPELLGVRRLAHDRVTRRVTR